MSRKKYSKEFKLKLIKEHNVDGISYWKLGKNYGIHASIIQSWRETYATFGEDGLEKHNVNLYNYSSEFKQMVVAEYLKGNISLRDLAHKHKILAPSTVKRWIKQYNNHEELADSRKAGEFFMVRKIKARKTTLEERITIVEYCITNSKDYAATAKKFNCSYSQIYSWVNKYTAKGVDGLKDGRGRNKAEDELSELEKLKAEIRILKAEKKRQQLEIDLLKKLEEIEGR